MKPVAREPLTEEAINGSQTINEFDRYAGVYMQPEYWFFVKKIRRRGFKNGQALDIGTGSGRLAIELIKNVKRESRVIGLDLSSDMLNKAEVKAAQSALADRLSLVRGSGSALPFADGSFDLVISYASLHHWRQPESVINEIIRVLKENGRVLIRDNRRVIGRPFWEVFIRLMGCLMSRKRYLNWRRVILASYTLPEVEALIKKTNLKNYRIGTDFVKFDLYIEAVKS
jgi:ubiquinone/menaquinone biosynthesis C-methylase UbiE